LETLLLKEKDAICQMLLPLLQLIQKNIYLLYNTSEGDGLDTGEKSRFITQLEVEKQALIIILLTKFIARNKHP
jgi:hypothetical protein